MPVINISVENKIAEADGTLYVCGNSDFVAKFAFDAEWEAYENKTARFCYNNSYVDVVFTGDKCPVPIISGTYFFNIGVYAGDLHTTTPARVPCKKSILCDTGFPADPPDDVYNQIMAKLNSLGSADPEAIAKAVADYLAAHPIEETDPTVPEWAKADITGATVGQIVKIAAVDASGVPTAWSPVDMPSGGGGDFVWEKIADINVADDVAKGVSAWEYTGLPGYDAIMYFKQNLKGESSTVSGISVAVNGGNSQPSGIAYSQGGYSCVGLICLSPFGMLHLATGNASSATNFSNGGMASMYCPIPTDGDHITSIRLKPHLMYKVVSGKLTLYGGKHQ